MIKVIEEDGRFYIKESTIPNAGLGLFAKHPINKGSWLEIIGVMMERDGTVDKCTAYANKYKFGASEKGWIIIPLGYAAIINHANTKEEQNCEIRHVRAKIPNKKLKSQPGLFSYSGEACYYFIRDVKKDEEILGNYGIEWRRHQDWLKGYGEDYDKSQDEWNQFLSYELYNMPFLRDKIPLEV